MYRWCGGRVCKDDVEGGYVRMVWREGVRMVWREGM